MRDHCAAIDLAWRKGRVGEVYNIGGRCERTNLQLTHALLDVLGKPPESSRKHGGAISERRIRQIPKTRKRGIRLELPHILKIVNGPVHF